MTPLDKPVRRKTPLRLDNRREHAEYVVTLYPCGEIGLRKARCRHEERLSLSTVYMMAVKQRMTEEAKAKKQAKQARKEES